MKEIRIENLNVKEVIELLSEMYKRYDYCDMVVNLKQNSIFFEPPPNSPSPEYTSSLRVPEEYLPPPSEIDQIIVDEELLRLLSSRKKPF